MTVEAKSDNTVNVQWNTAINREQVSKCWTIMVVYELEIKQQNTENCLAGRPRLMGTVVVRPWGPSRAERKRGSQTMVNYVATRVRFDKNTYRT